MKDCKSLLVHHILSFTLCDCITVKFHTINFTDYESITTPAQGIQLDLLM